LYFDTIQHAPPNRPPPVIDPPVVPTVDEQAVVPLDVLPPLPPDDDEVLAVCEVEPFVPCAAVPCVDACDPPVTGEPPTGADGTGAVPLTWAGETMVWVGPARGSVPQDDDVVTPAVPFWETEQGMSGMPVIGSGMPVIGALRSRDEGAAPDVEAPVRAVGEPGALGAASPGVPGVSVCAGAGPKIASDRIVARMNRRSIAISLFVRAV
jgi:hypothetical protein